MSNYDTATSLPFVFVDYASSPYDALAKDIVAREKPNPSDLSQFLIWCESRTQIHTMTLSLVNAGKAAGIGHLLLPNIITMQDWIWQQATPNLPAISETNKQLLLVEAIRQSPTLFQTNNAWPLAKELIGLFNECTLAQVPLHASEQTLRQTLQDSYQYPETDAGNISRESEIVYRLWQAYREQLQAGGWLDPIDYYCNSLLQHEFDDKHVHYFVIGKHRLCIAEVIFLQKLMHQSNVSIYASKISHKQHGSDHHPHIRFAKEVMQTISDNNRERALDIIYDKSQHTYDRINQFKQTFQSNTFNEWLALYTCKSIESHVRTVCLQAKKWLIEGTENIGIVSNDRLLIRRIRAVLEEQGIFPTDLGGWTLSTTSAATSIEVLLDAIEHNFKKDALLDLLTSPFLPANIDSESPYAHQTYALRKFLKKHRSSPLDNLDSLTELAIRHFTSHEIEHTQLSQTLATINTVSATLQEYKDYGEHPLSQFSDELISTLKALSIYTSLQDDVAGQQLLETLENHIQAIRSSHIKMNWKEWRQWLRDIFEHNYFIPEATDKRVILCGFEHIDRMKFDAVIIAGVEENRLTYTKNQRTFFNEKVRHELHLPTCHEANAINVIRFRQLITQSNRVLLSAETDNHGEPQELCAWVKLINIFSKQCYDNDLEDTKLDELLKAYLAYKENIQLTENYITHQPQTRVPRELVPTRISATQYQSLMDCPYQYFAKYILSLRDLETADDFEASDFGMLVHQSLKEFHFNGDNKSELIFNDEHRESLIQYLVELSQSIFMRAAFPTTVKQGWLQRWLINVPAYIDWAIERAKDWHTLRGEALIQTKLNNDFSLYGQIDRIDSDTQHFAVVDYKTGSSKPSKRKVMNGELVQLPFYALLDENITQAEYLNLGTQGLATASATLNKEELSALKSAHKTRLENLLNDLLKGSVLKAHGNYILCKYLHYLGLSARCLLVSHLINFLVLFYVQT